MSGAAGHRGGYHNPAVETMPRPELEALQLAKLRQAVDRALRTTHYQKKLAGTGISSGADIKSLADLRRLPFTSKNDLREAFPDGLKAVPQCEVVRMHASSGTTGIPTVIYFSQNDINRWAELGARSAAATGCTSADIFQNMMSYGLFTGGLGMHYGAEKLGMMVIPVGGGNTQRQIKLMKDFGTTVVHATPSYLLHVHDRLAEFGVRRDELKLQRAFVGAEPHTEEIRCKLQELWGIQVFNSYGLSEMNGPGVAFECGQRAGMHLWEDAYIMEIIDPDTGEVLPEGAEGELVLTILDREATPILRYRTRDLTSIMAEPCGCGRTHRRIRRIKGRSDDMLIINGVNVFPSQIEEVVMKTAGLGSNYQILVKKDGALDSIIVKLELDAPHFSDDMRELEALRHRIAGDLQTSISIRPKVELHEPGVLPVSEGKAVRVVDERPKMVDGPADGCR
jgi:phenylacetate-CoA ligase